MVFLPPINERRNKTIKIKNKTLAIVAAPAAIPPKPKIAAITATIRKMTVQRNITVNLKVCNVFLPYLNYYTTF